MRGTRSPTDLQQSKARIAAMSHECVHSHGFGRVYLSLLHKPNRVRLLADSERRQYSPVAKALLAGLVTWIMPLRDFHLRASIAVSDIQQAAAFYEGKLGLQALRSGPSAKIADGSRVYGSGGGPALNVYQSVTAGKSPATMATWYVDDIEQVVDELTASGVEFTRYDEFDHDAKGITARAGGGRIAWFQDPDGNTFAIEADA
jgi:catechol 2,3-dioxygenase-like lactoylglutathione lyase family enzyme